MEENKLNIELSDEDLKKVLGGQSIDKTAVSDLSEVTVTVSLAKLSFPWDDDGPIAGKNQPGENEEVWKR